jgi:hypothetical protein
MSYLAKTRWADRAFLLLLMLLAGVWMVFPPQRIDPPKVGDGLSVSEAAVPAKPRVAR